MAINLAIQLSKPEREDKSLSLHKQTKRSNNPTSLWLWQKICINFVAVLVPALSIKNSGERKRERSELLQLVVVEAEQTHPYLKLSTTVSATSSQFAHIKIKSHIYMIFHCFATKRTNKACSSRCKQSNAPLQRKRAFQSQTWIQNGRGLYPATTITCGDDEHLQYQQLHLVMLQQRHKMLLLRVRRMVSSHLAVVYCWNWMLTESSSTILL